MGGHIRMCPHVAGVPLYFLLRGRAPHTALRSSSLDDTVNYGLEKEVTHKAEEHKAINTDVVINTLHSNAYVSVLTALALRPLQPRTGVRTKAGSSLVPDTTDGTC